MVYSNIGAAMDGGIYTNFNTATLNVNNVPASVNGYTYQVVIYTTGGCTVISAIRSITVNELADITGHPPNRSVCAGNGTTFSVTDDGNPAVTARQWQISTNGGVSYSNLSNGGVYSGVTNATLTLSAVPIGYNNYRYRCILTTAGGCTITSNAGLLTVYPLATTTNPANTSVCVGQAASFSITAGGAPRTIKWERSTNGSPPWTTITGAAIPADGFYYSNFTTATLGISNAQTGMNNYQYRAILTTNTGSCPTTSAAAVLTVNPLPIPTIIGPASVCAGSSGNVYTTEAGMTNYVWNISAGGTITAGGGTGNRTVTITWNGTGNQTVSVNYTNANGCTAAGPTIFNVAVGTLPTSATLNGNGDVCFGTASIFSLNIAGGAPPYKIDYNLDGVPQAQITGYNSGDIHSLGALAVNPAHTVLITKITDACNAELTTNLPGLYTFAVNGIPDAGGTTNNTPMLCNNGITDIILQSTVPATDFEWTVSNLPPVTWVAGRAPADGTRSNGNGTSITQQLAHTGNQPVSVTYTITPTGPGSTACPGAPITRTVIVEPTPVISSPAKTICNNTATAISVSTSTTTSNTTYYTWTVSGIGSNITGAVNGPATGTPLSTLLSQTLNNSGTTAQTVTYNITPRTGTAPNALLCSGTPITVVVTVEPTPVISSPAKTICNNTATAISVSTSTTTSNTTYYTWTVSGIGSNITGAVNGPATGTPLSTLLSQTLNNSGTTAQTVTYNITPRTGTAPNALLCSGTPITVVVTVEPTPVISSPAKTICNNTATAISVSTSTTTSNTTYYTWTVSGIGSNITGAVNGPATGTPLSTLLSQTLNNSGTTAQTVTYNITPRTGTAPNALLCSGTPITVVVTVEPTPVISSPAKTICNNTATAISVSTSTTTSNTTYYTWTVSGIGSNITGAVNGPATGTPLSTLLSQTLNNSGTTAQTVTYNITPRTGTAPNALLCSGTPITVVVTVEPTPVISSPAKTICNNTATAISVSTSTTTSNTTYYTWTVSGIGSNITGAVNGPATGTPLSTLLSQTLNNSGTTAQTVTYNITPRTGTAPNALLCSGTPITVVVTVEPTPVISSPAKTICNNTATAISVSTSTTTSNTTYYTWTVSGIGSNITGAVNGPATGTPLSTLLSQTLNNSGTTAQTVTYNITPRTGTAPNALLCSGTPITVVITVEPTQDLTIANLLPDICAGGATNVTINTTDLPTNPSNLSFDLTVVSSDNGATGDLSVYDGTNLSYPYNFSKNIPNSSDNFVTVTLSATPKLLGCPSGATEYATITVEPLPKAAITHNGVTPICDGENVDIDITSVSKPGAGNSILFDLVVTSTDDPNTGGSAYNDLSNQTFPLNITGDLVNNSNQPITVTFKVTPKIGSCTGSSVSVDVVVYPSPELTSAAAVICNGNAASAALVCNVTESTFNWVISSVSNVYGVTVGQTGSGDILSEVLFNDGTNGTDGVNPGTVVYSVTPLNTPLWGGCVGTTANVTITVNPATHVSITQDEYFIAAGDIVTISGSITGGTADGTWSVVSSPVEGAFGDTDFNNVSKNSTTFDPTDLQDVNGTVIIRLTSDDPDNGGPCAAVYYEATIHIGATPTSAAGDDRIICEPSGTPQQITLVGRIGGSGISGSWSAPLLSGTLSAPVVTGPHDNGTSGNPDDDYYEVTQVYTLDPSDLALPNNFKVLNFVLVSNDPDGAGPVLPASDDVNITVQTGPHTPAIGGGGKTNMCITAATGQFYSVPFTLNNRYIWSVTGGTNGVEYLIQPGTGGVTQSFIVLNFNTPGNYTLKVTEETPLPFIGGYCTGEEVTLGIAVYDLPVAIAGVNALICEGEPITLGGNPMDGTNPSATSGSNTYNYHVDAFNWSR